VGGHFIGIKTLFDGDIEGFFVRIINLKPRQVRNSHVKTV
jgi:hypothetical protein